MLEGDEELVGRDGVPGGGTRMTAVCVPIRRRCIEIWLLDGKSNRWMASGSWGAYASSLKRA